MIVIGNITPPLSHFTLSTSNSRRNMFSEDSQLRSARLISVDTYRVHSRRTSRDPIERHHSRRSRSRSRPRYWVPSQAQTKVDTCTTRPRSTPRGSFFSGDMHHPTGVHSSHGPAAHTRGGMSSFLHSGKSSLRRSLQRRRFAKTQPG